MSGDVGLPGFQMLQPQGLQQGQLALVDLQASSSQPVHFQGGMYGSNASGLPTGQRHVGQLALPPIPETSPPRPDTPPQRLPSNQSVFSPGTDLEASLDRSVDQAGSAQRPAPQAPALFQQVGMPAVGQAEDSQAVPSTTKEPMAEEDGITEQNKHPKESVSAQAAIDRLNAALEKRKAAKELGSDVGKPSSGSKTPNMKKPASSKAKPKAAPKAKVKPSTLKRPASSQASASSSSKGKISRTESFKLMPKGCTSCRFVAGCTRSCWKKRKYEPLW